MHELVLSPEPTLQLLADVPSPEPASEDKELHSATAVWAPAGDAVLLQYLIRNYDDPRPQYNTNCFFEIGSSVVLFRPVQLVRVVEHVPQAQKCQACCKGQGHVA